ncbi:MAG: FAD-dependent oxidoreductase, partial [Xanthomonadaceae bacterium]|nr:FAD-dependent oxidoreductase [Xanthomonadaceae bacterium]
PSIADPFLPQKIEQGRVDDIRECIGCNVCVSGDMTISPIRCTQNPTMGEEWRKGWHPERIAPARTPTRVLVVGAGPAGLEAARALGQRGCAVSLAEARRELGGRVTRESRLPGLAEWARVRDWRVGQIHKLANVDVYLDSVLSAQDVLDFGAEHVVLATGCHWRRDGYGRSHGFAIPGFADSARVYTPDDLMDGRLPQGRVVVFDDDGYYHAGVAAELLRLRGCEVIHLTPEDSLAPWTLNTLDYRHVRKRMAELGIEAMVSHDVVDYDGAALTVEDVWTHRRRELACDAVVTVTARLPDDALWQDLNRREAEWTGAGIRSVRCIGDAEAPGLIAHAVYAGHRYARELQEPAGGEVAFKRHFHSADADDLRRPRD